MFLTNVFTFYVSEKGPSWVNIWSCNYCKNGKCVTHARKQMSLEYTYFDKAVMEEESNGCWPWNRCFFELLRSYWTNKLLNCRACFWVVINGELAWLASDIGGFETVAAWRIETNQGENEQQSAEDKSCKSRRENGHDCLVQGSFRTNKE